MSVLYKTIAILLFIAFPILALTGLMQEKSAGFPIVLLGVTSLFVGLFFANLSRKAKKIKSEKLEMENANNEYQKKQQLLKEEKQKEEEYLKNQINQNPIFNDGKVIHGVHQNAVVFSRTGEVGILTNDNIDIKITNVKDIKSMKYQMIKNNFDTKEWFCIFTINDFDNPVIKLQLSYMDEDNAKDLYNEIKALYAISKGV